MLGSDSDLLADACCVLLGSIFVGGRRKFSHGVHRFGQVKTGTACVSPSETKSASNHQRLSTCSSRFALGRTVGPQSELVWRSV